MSNDLQTNLGYIIMIMTNYDRVYTGNLQTFFFTIHAVARVKIVFIKYNAFMIEMQ